MRNMLALLAVVALTVGGVGWYLGWFEVHRAPSGTGQPSFMVDVNTTKISADLHNAEARFEKKLAEKAKDTGSSAGAAVGPVSGATSVAQHGHKQSSGKGATHSGPSGTELPQVDIPTIKVDR
jgi:hypothetical protein